MAGTLTFNVGQVRRLLGHAKAATEHQPSYEDLFEPSFHLGGKVKKDKNGWPDSENIDRTKVPAGLMLVADNGVYLMSNGTPSLLVEEGKPNNVVAYARESDPTSSDGGDDWYDAKRRIMGGDDCVITMESRMFEPVLAVLPDDGKLEMRVTSRDIRVVMPKTPKR